MAFRFWNKPITTGRTMILEALEERIVMDATVDALLHDGPYLSRHFSTDAAETSGVFYGFANGATDTNENVGSIADSPVMLESMQPTSAVGSAASEQFSAALAPFPALRVKLPTGGQVGSHGLDVVLISSNLEDTAGIAKAAHPNAHIIIFDGATQNLKSLDSLLNEVTQSSGKKIEHLAFASHGDAGALYIGSDTVDLNNLGGHKGEFEELAANLAPNAQIQFYACDLAGNVEGQTLVNSIAAFTGAQVFASADTTGATPHNWTLEYASSASTPMVAILDAAKLEAVHGELAQRPVTALNDNLNPHINGFAREVPPGMNKDRMAVATNVAVFSAENGAGEELYSSTQIAVIPHGVAPGQTQLTSFVNNNPHIREITPFYGAVVYSAQMDGLEGTELVKSDPNAAGAPVRLTHFGETATVIPNYDPHISQVTLQGGGLYFIAQENGQPPTDYQNGHELWKSNGTQAPAAQITDTGNNALTRFARVNGEGSLNPDIHEIVPSTNNVSVYFVGNSPFAKASQAVNQGYEIWRTDGTTSVASGNVTDFGGAEKGSVSIFGDYSGLSGYNPNLHDMTPAKIGAANDGVFFVGNDPRVGEQLWRSDGGVPVAGNLHTTENANNAGVAFNNDPATAGAVTNFPAATKPNIHEVRYVAAGNGGVDHVYFIADNGAGDAIFRTDGGVAGANATDFGQQTGAAIHDVSQLTVNGTDLLFVANKGTGSAPDYQIFRVQTTAAAGTQEQVTSFNTAPISAATPPAGTNPFDPAFQAVPAHTNAHIRLITVTGGNTLWFEADSTDAHSRELYRVTLPSTSISAPIPPTQVTSFGLGDPHINYLSDGDGLPVFTATEAVRDGNGVITGTRENIFTIANDAPVIQNPVLQHRTVIEDNNHTQTPAPLPNLIRVTDPDMGDALVVRVNATAGFSQQSIGGTTFDALSFTGTSNVSAVKLNNTTLAPDPSADGRNWEIQWNTKGGLNLVNPVIQQNAVNQVLASAKGMLNPHSNSLTDALFGGKHTITVNAYDHGVTPTAPSALSIDVNVEPGRWNTPAGVFMGRGPRA